MEYSSEQEVIETLVCSGISYSIACLLSRMVKEKWEVAEKEFNKLGLKNLYGDISNFHHKK